MKQRMKHGRLGLALGLALASVASLAIASPASAQSSRFGVLVAPVAGNAKQGGKIADQVRKNGRAFTFGVLNSTERRVIHLTLQKEEDLATESVGVGRERRLQVRLK